MISVRTRYAGFHATQRADVDLTFACRRSEGERNTGFVLTLYTPGCLRRLRMQDAISLPESPDLMRNIGAQWCMLWECCRVEAWFMGAEDSPARILEKALNAFLGPGASAREKVDKLYAFLDILDRKASSICTVNSLLMAVNGLLILRPPPSIDTGTDAGMHLWASGLLPFGVAAILLSLLTVLYAVFVNSMKWPFLHKYKPGSTPGSADPNPFGDEIQSLCEVVSERTRHVQRQRWATLFSIGATLAAVCMICYQTWIG